MSKHLYTIGLYEKAMPDSLTWTEKLLTAKGAGYDFVEISIDATEERINRVYMSEGERQTLVNTMFETAIPIRTMNVSALTKYALGDDSTAARGMDILKHALELAEALGVRIVMIPGYDIYYGDSTPETQQRFIKNLRAAAEMAAGHSILLQLETMENSFMNTVWKAMYYVRMIDSPYLGIYPDVGNTKNAALLQGCDEAQDLLSGRGHITAVHLKETSPGHFRDLMYGQGHVNFPRMIETAWQMGVRKYVTEFWYHPGEDWRANLQTANQTMRELLNRQEKQDEQTDKV